MKDTSISSNNIVKASKPLRTAGVPVRSGVKAGISLGDKEFGTWHGGELGRGKPGKPGGPL